MKRAEKGRKKTLIPSNIFGNKTQWQIATNTFVKLNHFFPHPTIEAQLLELRYKAFDNKKWTESSANAFTPKTTLYPPNSIPETSGLPDLETLNNAIEQFGFLIVRNLIPKKKAKELKTNIDHAFNAFSNFRNNKIHSRWYQPFRHNDLISKRDRKFIQGYQAIRAIDSPATMFTLLDTYKRLGVRQLLSDHFGSPPIISDNKCILRKFKPSYYATKPLPNWHQDGTFLGSDIKALNFWLPLTHCGGENNTTPRFEFMPIRLKDFFPTGTHGADLPFAIGSKYVDEFLSHIPRIQPEFFPGDVVIFDHYNLHRTYINRGMTSPRHSIECWFFASSAYPKQYTPLWF